MNMNVETVQLVLWRTLVSLFVSTCLQLPTLSRAQSNQTGTPVQGARITKVGAATHMSNSGLVGIIVEVPRLEDGQVLALGGDSPVSVQFGAQLQRAPRATFLQSPAATKLRVSRIDKDSVFLGQPFEVDGQQFRTVGPFVGTATIAFQPDEKFFSQHGQSWGMALASGSIAWTSIDGGSPASFVVIAEGNPAEVTGLRIFNTDLSVLSRTQSPAVTTAPSLAQAQQTPSSAAATTAMQSSVPPGQSAPGSPSRCSATYTINVTVGLSDSLTRGQTRVMVELRQGTPGNSKVSDTKYFDGQSGTVSFSQICAGQYFIAIGNSDSVAVGPVREFRDNQTVRTTVRVTPSSGNVGTRSRSGL